MQTTKTFSFQTCKGLLKIAAQSREEAVNIFKKFVRRNKRNEFVPIGRERIALIKRMIYG
jgi:hypothetical protein